MKHFSKFFFFILFNILIFSSCKKETTDTLSAVKTAGLNNQTMAAAINQNATNVNEKIVVQQDEESMPVWLYGNANSNTVILMVHGGPGDDVRTYRNVNQGLAFKRLETNYIVAYWQQRASGESQGPDNPKYYTIAQYAKDCDKVVDQLLAKYPGKQIVMMGHSWGGMLTSYYLRTSARRAKIKAWVDIDGVHNGTELIEFSRQDLGAEANKRIALKQNVSYWTSVKNDISRNPNAANGISYSCIENIGEIIIKVFPKYPASARAINSNTAISPELVNTNNNSYLKSYTLPTLVLWGKYDFSVSKKIRDQVLANSGSKKLVSKEFMTSSHFPMFQEPDEFAATIENFIKSL